MNVATNVVEVAGHLVRGTPKSHRTRSVPYPMFMAEQIAKLVTARASDEPLFTTPRGAMLRNNNFRHRVFDKAVKTTGLAPLTPHDLRDTAASLAIASGASVKAVQRMLGHASAAMTLDVYAGLFDDELDGIADRMHKAATRGNEKQTDADSVRTEKAESKSQDHEGDGGARADLG